MNNTNDFKWADELVQEYCARIILSSGGYAKEHLIDFKRLHTPAPERDWEVTEFASSDIRLIKHRDGTFGTYGALESELLASSVHTIFAVRRLSDNTTWTVGDEVKIVSKAILGWDRNPIHRIKYFALEDSGQLFIPCETDIPVCGNDLQSDAYKSGIFYIDEIAKLTPSPPKPQPLFVAANGESVFAGNKFFTVTDSFEVVFSDAVEGMRLTEGIIKRSYSTKEAADEYVLMNKPCLSLKEVSDIDMNVVSGEDFEEALLKLVKSKQS